MKNYEQAKELLTELAKKANQAIKAIDDKKPDWEICDLAVEDIDELTEQISTAILRNNLTVKDKDINIKS